MRQQSGAAPLPAGSPRVSSQLFLFFSLFLVFLSLRFFFFLSFYLVPAVVPRWSKGIRTNFPRAPSSLFSTGLAVENNDYAITRARNTRWLNHHSCETHCYYVALHVESSLEETRGKYVSVTYCIILARTYPNATPERCGVREPNIAFRTPVEAGCVCSKRIDGWMGGWMDGWVLFAYARGGGGVTTHCVNNDRVSCPLSSSWFSRLSPTRVDLGSRKGALCSRENRSDFRERQKAGNGTDVKQIGILLRQDYFLIVTRNIPLIREVVVYKSLE